jgi:hypothetical protein
MPGPYANIAQVDAEIQAALVKVLEPRTAEPRQLGGCVARLEC